MIFHTLYIIAKDSVMCLFAQRDKGEKQHKQFLCMYTVLRLLSPRQCYQVEFCVQSNIIAWKSCVLL